MRLKVMRGVDWVVRRGGTVADAVKDLRCHEGAVEESGAAFGLLC